MLIDVGGGLGALMMEILAANSSLKGIVADTPPVVQKTNEVIKARGIEERCQAVRCAFFKKIPTGGEAYLLSNILHDWSDEQCRIILKNCKRAMKKESRLLVIEMLVITGGRERTETEFKDLFESSGFKLSRIITTKEDICIIEGIRL